MVKMFQWLRGYVSFEFSKGFIEGFINDCFEQRINIQSLSKNGNILQGECSGATYFRLHRIARKNGGVVAITHKYGPIFALLRLRNRWGILVGIVCGIIIVNFLSGFIWNIDIVGTNEIRQADVELFLEENGLHIGSYSRSIDRDVIENLLMSSFDKCAWAHINIDGTTASIEIDETIDKPSVVDTKIVTNVKAIKDGVIVKATTFDGWQNVSVGDSVVEGDLLISGVYEGEVGKRNVFAHARGEIIAKVDECIELTVSRKQCQKVYTESKKYRSLYLFGIKIPLYIGSSDHINSDIEIVNKYIKLNSKELPIGIVEKNVKSFNVNTVNLNDKELNELVSLEMDKRISRELSDCEIISKDLDINLNTNDAKAECKMVCLEQIGKEYRINMKK